MKKSTLPALVTILLAAPFQSVSTAQLVAAKDARIVYGHHHLSMSDSPEYRKFWIEALGGVDANVPGRGGVVKIVNVLIYPSRGGGAASKGTASYDHIGLQVPDLRAVVQRVKAAGFPVVTSQELTGRPSSEDIAVDPNTKTRVAFVVGPGDAKVELIEGASKGKPIALDHIHFVTPDAALMQSWYVQAFNATPTKYGSLHAADLPGGKLVFSQASTLVTGGGGRALDHLGIEIRDLLAYCTKPPIKLEPHQRQIPNGPAGCGESPIKESPLKTAFLVDPSGARIELTEGMAGW